MHGAQSLPTASARMTSEQTMAGARSTFMCSENFMRLPPEGLSGGAAEQLTTQGSQLLRVAVAAATACG